MDRKPVRHVTAVVVLLMIAWGARLTLLQGLVFAWRSGFPGDFTSAMFTGHWWNGEGIIYGPIFVLESWLVRWLPRLFTPHFFAVANVFLAGGAFVFCVKACRAGTPVILVGLASWLCYWRLFYSFAVAANPEFLELFFLCGAWFAASRRRESTEALSIAAAGLTKLVPWVFVVPLVLRRSVRVLAQMLFAALSVILVVAIGQGMSLSDTIFQVIVPFNGRPITRLVPVSNSTEFVGVLEVIARGVYGAGQEPLGAEDLPAVRMLFATVVAAALCLTAWASIRLMRRTDLADESRPALMYAMYFALLPVLSVQAHAHTFLFLLPIWIVFIDRLWKDDSDVKVKAAFAGCLALCYVLTGFPAVLFVLDKILTTSLMTSWMRREPMAGNLLLLPVIWTYVVVRSRVPADTDPVADRRRWVAEQA